MFLNTKTVAALIGRSIYTLQRARCDRTHFDAPPCCLVGSRGVGYPLPELLRWAARRGVALDWRDFPARFVLPAVAAHQATGLPLPPDLRLRVPL